MKTKQNRSFNREIGNYYDYIFGTKFMIHCKTFDGYKLKHN